MPSDRTVFISHATGDRDVVRPCADLLEAAGVQIFFAPESIAFGEVWEDVLWKVLEGAERVLVFWSKLASESEWVKREYSFALERGYRVVPVPIDDAPMPPDLARIQGPTSFRTVLSRALDLGLISTRTEAGARLATYTSSLHGPAFKRSLESRRTRPVFTDELEPESDAAAVANGWRPSSRRGKPWLLRIVASLILLGAGWGFVLHHERLWPWVVAAVAVGLFVGRKLMYSTVGRTRETEPQSESVSREAAIEILSGQFAEAVFLSGTPDPYQENAQFGRMKVAPLLDLPERKRESPTQK